MSQKFATRDVLSASTGILLGDIGGVYKVVSYLVGRSVFTHELVTYGKEAEKALRAALPELPSEEEAAQITPDNYGDWLAVWEAKLGPELLLPDALRECLADDKTALQTAAEFFPAERTIVIGGRP